MHIDFIKIVIDIAVLLIAALICWMAKKMFDYNKSNKSIKKISNKVNGNKNKTNNIIG